MKNRTQRLLEIKKIISENKISSQEELLQQLEQQGLSYTQATLSRDLKFLKVSRVVDEEMGYIYKLPSVVKDEDVKSLKENFAFLGFRSLKFSNNFGVIKTHPGYAPGIASLIDGLDLFEILGTIAGDDNILIIPNEGVGKHDIINSLTLAIPELKEMLK
jgi:transcriptional regulator of arginine metabolism